MSDVIPWEVIEARQSYADIIDRGLHLVKCGYNGETPCTCYVRERLESITHAARLYPETPLYDVDGQAAALRRARGTS